MDPLAQIVTLLRPHAVLSKMVRGGGRWAVAYPAFAQPSFALVLEGPCWLTIEGEAPKTLSTGDFVLFPATPGFTLASERGVEPVPVSAISSDQPDVVHGDPAAMPSVSLLGGWFAFDAVNLPLLLDLLPGMLHVEATDAAIGDLVVIIDLIRRETATSKPGGALILTRLVEILLVEAIRSSPPGGATTSGLLAGLRDPRLACAVKLIHAEPARPWTLGSLARAAGMSRSSFAERFSRTIGQPPLAYLQRWRMAVARSFLAHDGQSVTAVARAVGYQSASAFSTAFSRAVGQPPRAFIRNG